jgi:hypothetical protein
MKKIPWDRIVRVCIYASVFLLGYLLISFAGTVLGLKQISATVATADSDKYEIRSKLLMETTDKTGVGSPEAAAIVWADGLKARSAAMQYTVMTKDLKADYAKQLETTFPNWVTGVSSPWIESYSITKSVKVDEDNTRYRIKFNTATSTGPAGTYEAMLSVTEEGKFWRIEQVEQDKELKVYTGFAP